MFDVISSIRDEDAISLYAPSVVLAIPDELEFMASLPLPPQLRRLGRSY
jgi:hypothetical protein